MGIRRPRRVAIDLIPQMEKTAKLTLMAANEEHFVLPGDHM